jgi:NADH-quinone oxidoreductase subunit C
MTAFSGGGYTVHPHRQAPADALAEKVRKAAGVIPIEITETKSDVNVNVAAEHLTALMQELAERKELSFDYLRNVTAIDMGADGLAAKYHIYSFRHGHSLQLSVLTPPGNPHIPSITSFYAAANWHEREAAEMVGLVFDGHPNLKNLLLEEDLRIHPLLKSHPLQKVEILQGIEDDVPGFKF